MPWTTLESETSHKSLLLSPFLLSLSYEKNELNDDKIYLNVHLKYFMPTKISSVDENPNGAWATATTEGWGEEKKL